MTQELGSQYPGWAGPELSFDVDGRAIVGNPVNGDVVYIGLLVDRDTDRLQSMTWRLEGSTQALHGFGAWAAALAGKSLDEIMGLDGAALLALVEVPVTNDMAEHLRSGLHKAINNYFARTGQRERITKEERNVICACQDVSDFDLRQVYLRGNQRLEDIKEATGVCSECDLCVERVTAYVEELQREFPMNVHAHIRH